MKPRLLDLFCGEGGASEGYRRAGFDVVGVDIVSKPRYPFEFHIGDAMTWPLDGFAAVHASPPCQDHTRMRAPGMPESYGTGWMLAGIREKLMEWGGLWVIENVPGAPMRIDYRLCGYIFGLPGLRRDRWFEVSWGPVLHLRPPCRHIEPAVTVVGHGPGSSSPFKHNALGWEQRKRDAMGIEWMTREGLSQAIPPAYTELIGADLMDLVRAAPPRR